MFTDFPPGVFDQTYPLDALMVRADWCDENGDTEEGELTRLCLGFWGPRGTADIEARIKHLNKRLNVVPTKEVFVNKVMKRQNGSERAVTYSAILSEPVGMFYTKITVPCRYLELFEEHIRTQPIIHAELVCGEDVTMRRIRIPNPTPEIETPQLINKYLSYKMLWKVNALTLNNLNIPFVDYRKIFKDTVVHPHELHITGTNIPQPSDAQLQLMPRLCPTLRHLKKLTWGKKVILGV